MREELIIAGFGGQGIMFTGTLLAQAAMIENKFVTYFPSYGAEVRGGTANCSVIIADSAIGSPVITSPDSLLILNKPSLDRFKPRLKKGGLLVLNSSLIEDEIKEHSGQVMRLPATDIAEQIGQVKVANIVALGKYLAIRKIVSQESVLQALEALLTGKKKELLGLNRKALIAGYEYK
ncbi:MAG: 2-oxoacid:acceptor oxidoreductase family protein [bacterium]|nr:2-oxoacid:acceptor oxidoreductase family protein [bacterium]MDD5756741.1 2-oxoacid:acceptor oxidoreductase family protein [bacterium]